MSIFLSINVKINIHLFILVSLKAKKCFLNSKIKRKKLDEIKLDVLISLT